MAALIRLTEHQHPLNARGKPRVHAVNPDAVLYVRDDGHRRVLVFGQGIDALSVVETLDEIDFILDQEALSLIP